MAERMLLRDWLFYLLMLAGVAAAIYHMANNRVMNGILVLGGVIVGSFVRYMMISDPDRADSRASASAIGPADSRVRRWLVHDEDINSDIWLRSGIIAGFVATVVMSVVMVAGFLSAGMFASENGSTAGQWFYGLTHNSLTEDTFDIPLGAYSINLFAGIIWAVVYGAFAETRLSGPGWWRGMKFSILPWMLSLVVFFPIVGAGILGLSLDAGPLPAIGNLILHLAYGATLGIVYAIPEASAPDSVDPDPVSASLLDRGLAAGLTIGLAIGTIGGAILAVAIGGGSFEPTEIILAGAAAGVMVGALVGPLVGLESGSAHRSPVS
ncbi:MAG: DUF6789 family protein [Thermomicrobiales bacterium]